MKKDIHETVRKGYAAIAKGRPATAGCCGPASSCCGGGDAMSLAKGIGYSEAELKGLPEGANMGLSCGNPTALAELKRGEVVLDLGSGGGFDVFVDPMYRRIRKALPRGRRMSDYVTSLYVTARAP